jgi:glycosyltransferase involved in cell wall biosynthesis
MPNLSVVVPAQNRLKLLKLYLDSSLSQELDHEVVVVDYMSNDGTMRWLKGNNHSKLRKFRVPGNKGFNLSTSRNIGITESLSPIILTLDADVLAKPGALLYWLERFKARESNKIVMPTVGWGNMFFYRSLWELCGGYPDIFRSYGYEDTGFAIRAQSVGGDVWWAKEFKKPKRKRGKNSRRNNKWFFTAKPGDKGHIKVQSNWEDELQSASKTLEAFRLNHKDFPNRPLPKYYEIRPDRD